MTKTSTVIFGVIFLLFGILGFVSNPLIGIHALFAADSAHNVLHALIGLLLLGAALRAQQVLGGWLKGVGGAVFLIGLLGLITIPSTGGTLLGIAYSNGPTNWFHLLLGIAMVLAGVYAKDDAREYPESA